MIYFWDICLFAIHCCKAHVKLQLVPQHIFDYTCFHLNVCIYPHIRLCIRSYLCVRNKNIAQNRPYNATLRLKLPKGENRLYPDISVYIYVLKKKNVCIYIYICLCIFMYIQILWINTKIRIHIHVHIHIHIHIHIHMHMHLHMHIRQMHMHIRIHVTTATRNTFDRDV